MSSERDDTSTKWKVYSGFQCEYDYRDWEDELLARLRLKRLDYLLEPSYANVEPPTHSEAEADAAKLQTKKDYCLVMSNFFDMTSDLPRKMIRRATIPLKALNDLCEKFLEGKSDDDYVELVGMWENLKPVPKEADPDGLLDLMLELNERMIDVHPDLEKAPIEFYAKYKRLLHKDYDPCVTTFNLARTGATYRPIKQSEFDELTRTIQSYWKAHFKKEDSSIVDKAAIYNLSNGNKCEHCGKTNHTAFKDGKPFCYKLIKDLKGTKPGQEDKNASTKKTRTFCKYCKSNEHDVRECPRLAKKKANNKTGLNHLFISNIDVCKEIISKDDDEIPFDMPNLVDRSDSSEEYTSDSDAEDDSDSDSNTDTMPTLKNRNSENFCDSSVISRCKS